MESAPPSVTRISLPESALAILDGAFALRDPRGRSPHPHILHEGLPGSRRLILEGDVLIRHDYRIPPEDGHRFVAATNDPNPIHRAGDVVPGAMTLARALLPLEALLEGLALRSVHVKFTRIARYGLPLSSRGRLSFPEPGRARFEAVSFQGGESVAEISAQGEIRIPPRPVPRPDGADETLSRISEFLQSLHLPPRTWFEPASGPRYAFPAAYLVSMPSGTYVRNLEGEGGIINALTLEFDGEVPVPVTAIGAPAVECVKEPPKRSFHRVLTKILGGVMTLAKGFAILRPGSAKP